MLSHLTQRKKVFYLFLIMDALRKYLDYITYCERQSICDDISDMTANMSEISAYNIRMRKEAEKASYTEPKIYMLENDKDGMEN